MVTTQKYAGQAIGRAEASRPGWDAKGALGKRGPLNQKSGLGFRVREHKISASLLACYAHVVSARRAVARSETDMICRLQSRHLAATGRYSVAERIVSTTIPGSPSCDCINESGCRVAGTKFSSSERNAQSSRAFRGFWPFSVFSFCREL